MLTKIRHALDAKPRAFGVVFVMLAGGGYGTGPWFAENLERNGANPMGFLTARFTMSAIVLILVRLAKMQLKDLPSPSDSLKILHLVRSDISSRLCFISSPCKTSTLAWSL